MTARRSLLELTTGPQRAPACSPAVAAIPAGVEAPRGRFLPRLGRGLRAPALSGALAIGLILSACEADHIAARAVLEEQGLHPVAFSMAPLVGRPCGWGEPFALRFRAVREDGSVAAGILCSADESAQDARLLADTSEAPRS